MPPKRLDPVALKLMKGLIVVELLGAIGAYGLFIKMDRSRDFRNKMKRRFPMILEGYYKSNELGGVYGVRERDQEAWASQN